MFNIFPISLLIIGLGGFIFIISNHLSEFSEDAGMDEPGFSLRAKLASWINQLPLDTVKSESLSLSQKLLHRMRIILLKTDNYLMKLIGKISEKDQEMNGNGLENKKKDDFWEDLSKNRESNEKIVQKEFSAPEPEVKIDLTLKSNPEAEKFFDIKPVKKMSKVKIKKSSK